MVGNVLEFPRPRLRLGIVSFRDFLRWRVGYHYNNMLPEWLGSREREWAPYPELKSPAQSPAPGLNSDVCP